MDVVPRKEDVSKNSSNYGDSERGFQKTNLFKLGGLRWQDIPNRFVGCVGEKISSSS